MGEREACPKVGDGAGGSVQDGAYGVGGHIQVCRGREDIEAVGRCAVSPGVLGRLCRQPACAVGERQAGWRGVGSGSRLGMVTLAVQGAVGIWLHMAVDPRPWTLRGERQDSMLASALGHSTGSCWVREVTEHRPPAGIRAWGRVCGLLSRSQDSSERPSGTGQQDKELRPLPPLRSLPRVP